MSTKCSSIWHLSIDSNIIYTQNAAEIADISKWFTSNNKKISLYYETTLISWAFAITLLEVWQGENRYLTFTQLFIEDRAVQHRLIQGYLLPQIPDWKN